MAYRDYYGSGGGRRIDFAGGGTFFPSAVKWLLISNIALFIAYFFAYRTGHAGWFTWLGLMPAAVTQLFAIWQLVTYLFIHSPVDFDHILLNMLALWMFGKDLENTWGTRRFLRYYFLCGIGAGIVVVVLNALFGDMHSRTIGASGAIYGLLLAFGVLFPDANILFFGLFPVKAKYFVAIVGAISFMMTFGDTGGGVSHMAHLGGMLWGYLYLKSKSFERKVSGADPLASISKSWSDWRRERAKRRFQVYLRKQKGSDGDRFVN